MANTPTATAAEAAFTATVAAARKMSAPPLAAQSAPEDDADDSSDEATDTAEAESTEETTEADDSSEETTEESKAVEYTAESAEKTLKLILAGKMKEAIKSLGGDPKAADTSDRKFRAIREKEERLEKKEANRAKAHQAAITQLTGMSDEIIKKKQEFHREHSFVIGTRKAVSEKNWPEVAKGLQALTGLDLATLTQKLASGKIGFTADEKKLEEDRQKLANEKAEFEANKNKKPENQAENRATAVKKVGEALKAHPFIALGKGKEDRAQKRLERVFKTMEESWDGTKFTKTPKQCADELHKDLLDDAKTSGFKVPKTAPKTEKKLVRGEEPPTIQTKKKDIDTASTFDQRVAAARRITSQHTRQ